MIRGSLRFDEQSILKNEDYVEEEYFHWLCSRVEVDPDLYGIVMRIFFDTEFHWTLAMDENRATDGKMLRYEFAEYFSEPYCDEVIDILSRRECSVLEMMVALAIKCEEYIMYDPDIGDRTYQWFWMMVENIHCDIFNEVMSLNRVNDCIFKLNNVLDRQYSKDGIGGFFPLVGTIPHKDQRKVEIWYQLNAYLNENYGF